MRENVGGHGEKRRAKKRSAHVGLVLSFGVSMAMLLFAACAAPAPGAVPAPEPRQTAETVGVSQDEGAPAPNGASKRAEPQDTATDTPSASLLIAAAASLEDCFAKGLIPLFQTENPGIVLSGTYDSSGKLQQQIEEGLEADIFMSAATQQMDALVSAALVDPASVRELLENEIVLIAAAAAETAIDSFEGIAEAETIAIGDPGSVPAGQYAREALDQLGVWEAIQDRLSLGTNVTEVLGQVAEGSADVGIVYATDAARMPDRVKILATAPEGSLQQRVIYPVGVIATTKQREAADGFMAFLQTPEAMRIFEENGFKPAK